MIYITAESFASFAADPKLHQRFIAWFMTVFILRIYTPYWEVSTIDGEYVNCLGLIPKSGTYSLKDSVKITFHLHWATFKNLAIKL